MGGISATWSARYEFSPPVMAIYQYLDSCHSAIWDLRQIYSKNEQIAIYGGISASSSDRILQ